ncbi:MAG: hypothetical protein L7S72_11075 [Flavobacteriales bacterium]|nr:hypothetical protein [Flavobacteriales bacterium]
MKNWTLSIGFCPCILFGYRVYNNEGLGVNKDEEIELDINDHTFYIGPLLIILTTIYEG